MELRQLSYVVAIADEGGFTRAAEALHVAQPGVSAQVALLERELGQRLFDRAGREVRLTAAGRELLPMARAALARVRDLQEAADALRGLVRGRVTAGVVTGGATVDATAHLAAFARDHPGVEVSLTEARADVLIDRLRDGRLDLAWLALGGPAPAGVSTHVLTEERLVAVVAPGDPLSRRRTVPLAALLERPLVCSPEGTGVRTALTAAAATRGLVPRVTSEAEAPYLLARLAAAGLGVALVPASAAAAALEAGVALHTVAVVDPVLRGRLAVGWRTGGPSGTAARALVEAVLAAV